LTTFFALPFGLGFHYLEKESSRDSKASLGRLFDELRQGIEHAVAEAGRLLAATIPTPDDNCKETADKITDILLFLSLVALREFGRQRGWITSQYRIPSKCMDKAMDGYNESQIECNVMSKIIMMLNQELKTFPSNRPEGT
jgi:hypothetical protein